jgi:hypothetical protein
MPLDWEKLSEQALLVPEKGQLKSLVQMLEQLLENYQVLDQ